jgi:hypothetical protein
MVLAHVTHQACHVLGDQAAHGAAGVHAHDHRAAGNQHEAGGLQVERVFVDERAGELGDRAASALCPRGM